MHVIDNNDVSNDDNNDVSATLFKNKCSLNNTNETNENNYRIYLA